MSFKDTFKPAKEQDEFWTELAILEFTSQLSRLMQEQGISKVELANLLGTSPAYVTKVFRGDANFTMRSMVKLARTLGGRFTPQVVNEAEAAAALLSAKRVKVSRARRDTKSPQVSRIVK